MDAKIRPLGRRRAAVVVLGLAVLAASYVGAHFSRDISAARVRADRGARVVDTRCGRIEYAESGRGAPILVIHGAGGGHDQGMAIARDFAGGGVRVVAVSRFGYLGTPMPEDGSPEAQADANICLLDALRIDRAAVFGVSAGALSAMQTAIRHPGRVESLVLMVPLAYKPAEVVPSAPRLSPTAQRLLDALVGSDLVFWIASHVARDQVIERVLGTPAEVVAEASAADQARVQAMLDSILQISARAAGLRNEAWQASHLRPYPLDRIIAS